MANDQIVRALAEQAYMFHLLVKCLREGALQPGAPMSRWNDAEFQEFLGDYEAKYFAE